MWLKKLEYAYIFVLARALLDRYFVTVCVGEISVLKQLAFQKFPRTLILPSDGVIKCLLRSKTGRTFLSIELLGEGYELLKQIFEKLKYTKVDRKPFMFGQSRHDVNHCRLTSCNLNQLVLEPDRIKF